MKKSLAAYLLVFMFFSGSIIITASPVINEADFQIAVHEEEPDPFD